MKTKIRNGQRHFGFFGGLLFVCFAQDVLNRRFTSRFLVVLLQISDDGANAFDFACPQLLGDEREDVLDPLHFHVDRRGAFNRIVEVFVELVQGLLTGVGIVDTATQFRRQLFLFCRDRQQDALRLVL